MEGGTCAPDPEESAKMLNLLSEVGLVGSKLAVSHGTEQSLAKQLTDRLGIDMKPWHTTFIVGQVREAVQMSDLDERVTGTSSSRSMQNLLDARAAAEKEKVKALEPTGDQLVVPTAPKRGTLGRTVRLKSGRIAAEHEVTDKILERLVTELMQYKAPILDEIKKAMNPTRAKEALIGKYRLSTVRRYLASWQRGGRDGEARHAAQQRDARGLHVCPRGRRHGTIDPACCEHCSVVVRAHGRDAGGGPTDGPGFSPDGHEGADAEAGTECTPS